MLLLLPEVKKNCGELAVQEEISGYKLETCKPVTWLKNNISTKN